MKKTISERINDAYADIDAREYILPFFWMHGEPHEQLEEEIDAIYKANIREFCLESRTHMEFGKDKWWEDMGFMLEQAKVRGMRVWLLDDKFFPTGYANAYINDHPELKRVEIRLEYRDFAGPKAGVLIRRPDLREGERVVAVTAKRRNPDSGEAEGVGLDLTERVTSEECVKRGLFSWDVPEGVWRVYYIIRTTWSPGRPEYIDMLSPESCRSMIHAVYQPVFDHFAPYFGNTFAGFFSDEPCFANDFGTYYEILGRKGMMIPYRDDLCELMAEKLDMDAAEVRLRLPELFHSGEGDAHRMIRWAYMDTVSELLEVNFSRLLGEWSRAHGVKYIGHIIEDSNIHMRLGQGPGHYFRAIGPMDMAGIDIVLNQYTPGMTEMWHTAAIYGGEANPEFFNYLLTAMPASLSRLEPRMNGNTMCEIFGAFGWAEGVPMMKKMLDHMLSGGINHFVPHAYTPKFPDRDCPPHFYARGNNAQAPAFGILMRYMSRLSHILSGGQYPADVAVFYNAEAEWCGGLCETLQRTAKLMDRGHVAFDIVWNDLLPEIVVENGEATVRGRKYKVLVVPESEYLPPKVLKELERLRDQGLTVVIHGDIVPKNAQNGAETVFKCVTWDEMAPYLKKNIDQNGWLDVDKPVPLLKYYRKCDGDSESIFLCSEDDFDSMNFTVTLTDDRPRRFYDAWGNKFYMPRQKGRQLEVTLPPSGSVLIVADDRPCPEYDYRDAKNIRPADISWGKVTLTSPDGTVSEGNFGPGTDVTSVPGLENFHGTIRYEGRISLGDGDELLRISEAGEIVTVFIDGKELGTGLERDCRFDISAFGPGEYSIAFEVVNSPAYMIPDPFSTFLTIPRSGLIGDVTVVMRPAF